MFKTIYFGFSENQYAFGLFSYAYTRWAEKQKIHARIDAHVHGYFFLSCTSQYTVQQIDMFMREYSSSVREELRIRILATAEERRNFSEVEKLSGITKGS